MVRMMLIWDDAGCQGGNYVAKQESLEMLKLQAKFKTVVLQILMDHNSFWCITSDFDGSRSIDHSRIWTANL